MSSTDNTVVNNHINSKPKKIKIKKKIIVKKNNIRRKVNVTVYWKENKSAIIIQSNLRGYNFRIRKVLEPCNINELDLDIERLRERLKSDYLTDGRMEFIKDTATNNIVLEDGFMEYITAKCINGTRVGEGHCPIDVTKDNKGIDILCVCLNGTMTNEKSIMQNFSNCGNNLDNLFENGKYQETLSLFIKEYHIKLLNAKKTKNINKLYYCAFISTDINVYISVFKINLECISNIKYENITKKKKSIKFKGFIDDKYGFTKLFKSKKRLEIRFNKEILNCYNTIKII